MRRRILLVVELDARNDHEADGVLDAFRETVLPSENYGLSIYRATPTDVLEFPVNESECFIPSIPLRGERP